MNSDLVHILVVDDDEEQVEILGKILAKGGYSVETTVSPVKALEKVLNEDILLVIADIRMPELDGIELLARIKNAKPAVRVILITAFGDWGVYAKALAEGATDFLSKPFKVDEILASVKKVCDSFE